MNIWKNLRRLFIAKSYIQSYEVDYNQTFNYIINYESIKIVLNIFI